MTLIHELIEPFHRHHLFDHYFWHERISERVVGSWKYVCASVLKDGNAEPLHSIRDAYHNALVGQLKIIDGYILLASCFDPDSQRFEVNHLSRAREVIQKHFDFLFPRWQSLENIEELILEGITPSNEILTEIAKRNPPPQKWYDESFEDLFAKSESP